MSYPVTRYFDGRRYTLHHDTPAALLKARQRLYREARKVGVRLITRVYRGTTLEVQADPQKAQASR